jgi:hypothetical protein
VPSASAEPTSLPSDVSPELSGASTRPEPPVSAARPPVESDLTEPGPAESAPIGPGPLESAPVEALPAEPKPVDSHPVEPESVEPAPVGPAPIEPQAEPVELRPEEPPPVEPASAEATPVEPAPVEGEPVEAAPVEPQRVGAVPLEGEPVEAAPVEPQRVGAVPVEGEPETVGASAPGQDTQVVVAAEAAPIAEPGRRSTESERLAFRAMAGSGWEAYAAPLRRVFSRLPAIAADERAAATVDFVAVRLYLLRPDEFGPAAVRSGGEALRPYLACLASGLDRLPTYRGAVVRGADVPVPADAVGTVLTAPGPVGGLPLNAAYAPGLPPSRTVHVIWSETARRVAALFDAESEETRRGDVVFAAGSRFAVLDVRPGDADHPHLVLLREIPPTMDRTPPGGRLVVTKLEHALHDVRPPTDATPPSWPAHCLGPIGRPPTDG